MPKGKVNKKRYATHITTPTGGRVYVSAKSQEELDAKVANLKAEMGAGVDISDNTLFNDYADLWLRIYKKPKIRQNTYDTLKWILEKHIKPVFVGMTLREIKPLHIQAFMATLSEYSYSIQAKGLQTVKAIFVTAEDNGLILKSPVKSKDKPGGAKPEEKEALTNAQAVQLLDAVKGTRAYLFCLLALSTGMRRGEILGLMWQDIDFDTGHINVTHSMALNPHREKCVVLPMLKSDAARRRLPIPLLLRRELEIEKRQSNSPYVFSMRNGEPLSKCSYDALWRVVTQRTVSEKHPLGSVRGSNNGGRYVVSLDFHCHPHLLRHTYITQLFESGLDIKQVQYLAGHSTPDMTLNVYTHYRRKAREQETASQVDAATAYLGRPEPEKTLPAGIVDFPRRRASATRFNNLDEGSGRMIR